MNSCSKVKRHTLLAKLTDKKAKWKWQILQKISLPITARLKILSIRGKYDPQMCAKV